MGLKLRSNNWESFKVSAPSAGYSSGDLVKEEDTIGVIVEDAEGDKVLADAVLIYKAEKILLPKKDSDGTVAVGAKVYLDSDAISGDGDANNLCGVCLEAAVEEDEEILVALDGTMGIPGSET